MAALKLARSSGGLGNAGLFRRPSWAALRRAKTSASFISFSEREGLMMLSFVFAMAVLPVKGLETRRAREKTGIDTRRLPLQPSGNHRLEKGDPPSPLIRDARAQARFDVCRKSEFIAVFQEQCRN